MEINKLMESLKYLSDNKVSVNTYIDFDTYDVKQYVFIKDYYDFKELFDGEEWKVVEDEHFKDYVNIVVNKENVEFNCFVSKNKMEAA